MKEKDVTDIIFIPFFFQKKEKRNSLNIKRQLYLWPFIYTHDSETLRTCNPFHSVLFLTNISFCFSVMPYRENKENRLGHASVFNGTKYSPRYMSSALHLHFIKYHSQIVMRCIFRIFMHIIYTHTTGLGFLGYLHFLIKKKYLEVEVYIIWRPFNLLVYSLRRKFRQWLRHICMYYVRMLIFFLSPNVLYQSKQIIIRIRDKETI